MSGIGCKYMIRIVLVQLYGLETSMDIGYTYIHCLSLLLSVVMPGYCGLNLQQIPSVRWLQSYCRGPTRRKRKLKIF